MGSLLPLHQAAHSIAIRFIKIHTFSKLYAIVKVDGATLKRWLSKVP